jgi:hypothetical protein
MREQSTGQHWIARSLGLCVLGSVFFSTPVLAKTFRTNFMKFELPPGWTCKQEEIDWVCQPDNVNDSSEVILIAVTKNVNAVDDSLENYDTILKAPKSMVDLLGQGYQSKVLSTRRRKIKDIEWIDSLHLGSEIPGFYTRYLAGIRQQVAGLITYSISESVYAKWTPIMSEIVDSAELFFDPKAFAEAMKAGPQSLLGSRTSSALKGRFAPAEESEQAKATESASETPPMGAAQWGALGAGLAVVIWVILRRRKKA